MMRKMMSLNQGQPSELVHIERACYQLQMDGLPETYLFHSPATAALVTNPWLAGRELQLLAVRASQAFLKRAYDICLKGELKQNICELVLMCGGNFYGTKEAFQEAFDSSIAQVFVGIKRYRRADGTWNAKASYTNFEALPDNATIIIGDTLATGSTLKKAILELRDEMKVQHKSINKIVVYTFVGSVVGAKVLREAEKELKMDWPKLKLYFFASEALFGLEANGTDMPFHHKSTVVIPETKRMLEDHPSIAHRMRCAIFDWGNRCKNPRNHYMQFVSYCEKLLARETDAEIRKSVWTMQQKAQERLDEMKREL